MYSIVCLSSTGCKMCTSFLLATWLSRMCNVAAYATQQAVAWVHKFAGFLCQETPMTVTHVKTVSIDMYGFYVSSQQMSCNNHAV